MLVALRILCVDRACRTLSTRRTKSHFRFSLLDSFNITRMNKLEIKKVELISEHMSDHLARGHMLRVRTKFAQTAMRVSIIYGIEFLSHESLESVDTKPRVRRP